MPTLDRSLQAQVKRLLSKPELFPDEFKNWVPKQVQDNANIKLATYQLPKLSQPAYVSSIAAGPPAAPVHNQIWMATDVDASGTCWKFRYNDNSSSSFKWEFVGGSPATSGPNGSLTTTTGGFLDLTGGPSITVARDGDYDVKFGVSGQCTAFTAVYFAQAEASFGGAPSSVFQIGCPIQWSESTLVGFCQFTNRVAGQAVTIKCQNDRAPSGTTTWNLGWLEVIPVRVS